MRVAVPKEIKVGEKRVALVPDVINKLTRLGLEVTQPVVDCGVFDFSTIPTTLNSTDPALVSSVPVNLNLMLPLKW